jgi:hypothetical protein
VRSLLSLTGLLAVCALAHAQSPDAGVPIDAAPSVPADAGVPLAVDAAPPPPPPPPVDAAVASPTPVDAAAEPDAAVGVSLALPPPSRSEDAAWLLVGGALTFITTGIVLAYAAEATETDIEDLYASLDSPTFDEKTQARYDELVKQGNRYQYLSWTSFGVATGMAIGATVFFWKHRKEPQVTPIVTPNSAGVSVRF